jgi:aminoglycoside phosphotransferase
MEQQRVISILPDRLQRFINGAALTADTIGESPCRVYAFQRRDERFFLKCCPAAYRTTTFSVLREARVLQWLSGKLKVAELVAVAEGDAMEFMITRAVPGEPLSARIRRGQPVAEHFLQAIRQLHDVPLNDCPFDATLAIRLQELDYLLSHDLIDNEYDLSSWPGLDTPQQLLTYLQAHQPEQEPVFSHGDLGDSNVFVDSREQLYFIDWGRGGIADPWLDIAFAHRNLREAVNSAVADAFLSSVNMPDRPEKRLYFELLDELF